MEEHDRELENQESHGKGEQESTIYWLFNTGTGWHIMQLATGRSVSQNM